MLQPFWSTRKWTMQTLSNFKLTVTFTSCEGAESCLWTECMGVALTNFRKQMILTIIEVNEIHKYLLLIGAKTKQMWRPCYTPVVKKTRFSVGGDIVIENITRKPNSLAAQSKTEVCGRSLAGIAGSKSARGMDVCCECCKSVAYPGIFSGEGGGYATNFFSWGFNIFSWG
jgi:hypothetical protein